MALEGVEFDISRGPEWDRVQAALTNVAAELPKEIKDSVSSMVDPWKAHAEADVISTPIKGVGKQTGLRREVAASVDKHVDGTAENFEVSVTSSLPHGIGEENEAIIPLGMDRAGGWRHPVFGHMDTWVQEVPLRHKWFTGAFEDHQDEVEREIQSKLDAARDAIAAAGA
jgi:hypothetical protein